MSGYLLDPTSVLARWKLRVLVLLTLRELYGAYRVPHALVVNRGSKGWALDLTQNRTRISSVDGHPLVALGAAGIRPTEQSPFVL